MLVVLLQINVLLTTLMLEETVDAQGCDYGWFGEKCMYKCHCSKFGHCISNGECPNNTPCEKGYFGPGCQYEDLVDRLHDVGTDAYLTDENEATCNPQSSSKSVMVTLTQEVPFMWFRIHVTQKNNRRNFILKINYKVPCTNQRNFIIGDSIVDVTCDTTSELKNVVIEGSIAAHICSIYISGGRNVALRQQTAQSSDFSSFTESKKAVDGNTNATLAAQACSSTRLDSAAEFNLVYYRPQKLIRIRVYNRARYGERLNEFSLRTFAANGRTIEKVTAPSNTSTVYDLILSGSRPVVQIRMTLSPNIKQIQRYLTICEMETLGETQCPDDKFGLYCSEDCKCKSTETCSPVTGACAAGCPVGTYGYQCLQPCNVNCLSGTCYDRSGYCHSCKPGYYGDYCKDECQQGNFGPGCVFNCSKHCTNMCSKTTGECSCQDGYVGSQCNECPDKTFGDDCSLPCPDLCDKGLCKMETGACLSCFGLRIGEFCQDCPPGYYGPFCYSRCSQFCLNESCDTLNGNCSVCTHGYHGTQCRYAPVSNHMWHHLILVLVLCLLPVVLLLIYLCRKAPPQKADDDDGNESWTTSTSSEDVTRNL